MTATPVRRVLRKIDGFLLYDKPRGIGSNGALQRVRRLYQAERAGHTGTLDPLASGLLVLCFGQATRFAGELLESQKTYLAEIRLGIRTSTGDAEGGIVEQRSVHAGRPDIESSLDEFRGEILQTPPMYSALKRDGVPLYRLARQGIEIPRAARAVAIYSIELVSMSLPDITIRVNCSKGTYIRVLAEDIGSHLGCGAYLSNLVRLGMGPFRLEDAVSDDALGSLSEEERQARLNPPEGLAFAYPAISIDRALAVKFCQGQSVAVTGVNAAEYRTYDDLGQFLGIGESNGLGELQPKRVMRDALPIEPSKSLHLRSNNL
jgi:tRNA pseudouridine55 synthase